MPLVDTPSLSKEIYTVLTSDPYNQDFRLSFVLDQLDADNRTPLVVKTENEGTYSIEVVCFQTAYLLLFREAHTYLNKRLLPSVGHHRSYGLEDYYATVALLVTTAEHKTVINIHEETVLRIVDTKDNEDPKSFLLNEFVLIKRLLTSSRNSINKSSSLWWWLRKLFVILVSRGYATTKQLIPTIISAITRSGTLHFANYYCWNTAKWFLDVLELQRETEAQSAKNDLIGSIKQFCFSHLSDCSSWNTMAYIFSQQLDYCNFNKLGYIALLERYTDQTFDDGNDKVEHEVSPQSKSAVVKFLNELSELIDKLEIGVEPPYLCIVYILRAAMKVNERVILERCDFLRNWEMEVNQGLKEQFVPREDDEEGVENRGDGDDLLKMRAYNCLLQKKRTLLRLKLLPQHKTWPQYLND